MNKITFFLTLLLLSTTLLNSKEPIIAYMIDVKSNSTQTFNIGKYDFFCVASGVLTLDQIYQNHKLDDRCKQSIENFYKKKPLLEYFSQNILKRRQGYHVEFKDSECLMYAVGQKTLSELLLENGLGVMKSTFDYEEFNYSFKKAERRAKNNNLGLWNDRTLKNCVKRYKK